MMKLLSSVSGSGLQKTSKEDQLPSLKSSFPKHPETFPGKRRGFDF